MNQNRPAWDSTTVRDWGTLLLGTGGSVDSLHATSVGRWLVVTRGSTHIWDIRPDGVLYQRLRGASSASFASDGVVVQLTGVERWPVVGDTFFIWFDDLEHPNALEQWRQSSTVQYITALPDDDVLQETA